MTSIPTEPAAPPSSPEANATPPPESRPARLARHGRRVRLYAGACGFIVLVGALIVLSSKNTRGVKLDWAVGSTHASLAWVILAAAVIGWLLGITTAVVFRHRTR